MYTHIIHFYLEYINISLVLLGIKPTSIFAYQLSTEDLNYPKYSLMGDIPLYHSNDKC